MKNKKIKLSYGDYPAISSIVNINTNSHIVHSPFANCQSYCINNANGLLNEDRGMQYFRELFSEICGEIGKYQFVIDVTQTNEKSIIEHINFLIQEKYRMPYTNTNGTPMALYVIQLDRNELL